MFYASALSRLIRALAVLTLVCAPARADEPTAPPLPKESADIVQSYGERHADCLEWTDSCTICLRQEGAAAACSTPGVACQPRGIACSAKREHGASSPKAK